MSTWIYLIKALSNNEYPKQLWRIFVEWKFIFLIPCIKGFCLQSILGLVGPHKPYINLKFKNLYLIPVNEICFYSFRHLWNVKPVIQLWNSTQNFLHTVVGGPYCSYCYRMISSRGCFRNFMSNEGNMPGLSFVVLSARVSSNINTRNFWNSFITPQSI